MRIYLHEKVIIHRGRQAEVNITFNPFTVGEYHFLYASTPSKARGKQGVVYMRVVSTIIFKGRTQLSLSAL